MKIVWVILYTKYIVVAAKIGAHNNELAINLLAERDSFESICDDRFQNQMVEIAHNVPASAGPKMIVNHGPAVHSHAHSPPNTTITDAIGISATHNAY